MGRFSCCSKHDAGLNRGAWTAKEDSILSEYMNVHDDGGWRSLPQRAGLKRCWKSCRLRWLNYLRPGIKRGNICPDEEELIIRLHRLLGNRWSLIAGRLPGRTDNEIKNYWNTRLRKRLSEKETIPKSKPAPPAVDRVFKPTPVKTSATRISKNCTNYAGTCNSNHHGLRSTGSAETAQTCKSWRQLLADEFVWSESPSMERKKEDSTLSISDFVECPQFLHSRHTVENEVNTCESLLHFHELSSSECDLLSYPSACSKDLGMEEFDSSKSNDLEEMCSLESNMQQTADDLQGVHKIYDRTHQVSWVDEYLQKSSLQPLSLLLFEDEKDWEEK